MIRWYLKKIESKKGSKKLFWKALVWSKDTLWKIVVLSDILSRRINFFLNYLIKGGKLPDFMIIGVQKGGTSFLYVNFKKHSKIEMCPNFISFFRSRVINTKEVHFFDNNNNWLKGVDYYKSVFNDNNKLQGEATPEYIYNLKSHERIYKTVPNVKMILVLRDPVFRAYSAYNHFKQVGQLLLCEERIVPNGSFEDNISAEEESGFMQGFVRRGFYIDQIEHLLKYFKREQLFILISERGRKNPQEELNKICDFLGISREELDIRKEVHKRKYDEVLSRETGKKLSKIYRPYNERLFKFLSYRIEEWEH